VGGAARGSSKERHREVRSGRSASRGEHEVTSDDDSELAGQYRDGIHTLLVPVAAMLRRGQDDGTLTLAESPELTASTLTNAYLGLAQRVHSRGDRIAEEQGIISRNMLTELAPLLMAGLITPRS
jgi:hypothetical protein